MKVEEIISAMAAWLKDGPVEEGDLCIVWLGGVSTYAVCTSIEPDAKPGWYDIQLVALDAIPPNFFGWRVNEDHLNSEIFHMKGVPISLIALEITELAPDPDDRDLATEDGNGLHIVKATKDPFGIDGG